MKQTLAALKLRLAERFGPDLLDVRLFGSYARGEADEDSDVDVFVLLRTAGWAERRAVLDLAGDLFAERNVLLSPTVFDLARTRNGGARNDRSSWTSSAMASPYDRRGQARRSG